MSDGLEIGFCFQRDEMFVRCGRQGCDRACAIKELLSRCSLEVKKQLHDYLGLYIVRDLSSRVGYRETKVELVAACANISTLELMKVLEYRASVMNDSTAKKIVKGLVNDDDEETEDSENSVITNLVWVDSVAGDVDPRVFSEGDMWAKIEELATPDEMKEIDSKIWAVDNLMADSESELLRHDESPGDRSTRMFIRWASDLLNSGSSTDYPLKLYSDALALDKFFYHMNESFGSLTIQQYDAFKESVLPLYAKRAIEYELPYRLDVRRYTHEFTDDNLLTRVYEPDDSVPTEYDNST